MVCFFVESRAPNNGGWGGGKNREEVVVSTALEIDSTFSLNLGNDLDKVEVISTFLEV